MKRIALFVIFFSLVLIQLWAVPANPNMITFTQSDGTELDLYQKGDEFVHWSETVDGYTVLNDGNNIFFYAILDRRGDMGRSGIQAHNINQRSGDEIAFLRTINKNYSFSKSQIDTFKETILQFSNRNSRAFPTTGTNNLLMILANFSDTSTTYPQSDFNNYMNQVNYNGTGSFKDFYLECSYGQLILNTTVTSWVTLPNPHDYYIEANWGEFALNSVQAADASVNYANYDNDSDGTVDGIAIIHQGPGQEATGNIYDIWSHSWALQYAGYTELQRTFDGVLVNAYTTQPETGSGGMATIGVMCHEFGHNLGAPDYYDTDYGGSGGQYDGMGYWDVMASGSYNGSNGTKPAHHNGFTKWYYYGWCTPTLLTSGYDVSMGNSVNNSTDFYYYTTTTSNEYFFLENRQQTGFDSGLPGHGLIILHADQDYIDLHDGSNDINASSHQGLYPKAANGTINNASCPFPGTSSNTSFTDTTTPNSQSWASANTNKPITNIQESIGVITFDFMGGNAAIADITANPTTFSETLGLNQYAQQTLTIANDGQSGSVLNYNLSIGYSSRGRGELIAKKSKSNSSKYEVIDSYIPTTGKAAPIQYDPSNFPAPRQGGDTVASAVVISSLPYNNLGTTAGYTDDYDEACTYTGSTSPDVVYSYTPTTDITNGFVSLCGDTDYDSKLYLYENSVTSGSPFACNDDECTSALGQDYVSELTGLSFTGGNTYYIVVDGYGGASGNYEIDITGEISFAWLTLNGGSQITDTITFGDPNDVVTVGFDSADLDAGVYLADIICTSNDPDEATVTIPVTFTVNDNSSSGSGNNGGGTGPAVVDLPLTNIDGSSVDPDALIDPAGDESIIVNVTVTDEVQGSVSVPNPENVIISYAVEVIGTITGVNLAFDLEFTGLSSLDQVYWLNGTNWLIPNNVSWSIPNHVTFDLTLVDRDASTEIILSGDDPLPVALSSFTALFTNGTPCIDWTTQSESDNIGWNIYRGVSNNLGQTLILNSNTIPGSGSTTEPTYYSYTDEYTVQEDYTYWYWLESICTDGETDFYGPVYLTIPSDGNEIPEIPMDTELYQNFPNPFNPNTLISLDIKENERGVLSIYNVKGQLIVKEEFEAGRNRYTWDAREHSSGVYLYKLQAGKYSKTMRMLLVK